VAKTAIQVPASRGTEPRDACTLTNTAGSEARRAKNWAFKVTNHYFLERYKKKKSRWISGKVCPCIAFKLAKYQNTKKLVYSGDVL
jgi:hypothetical protein